jgi:hypothetical protein
VIETMPTTPTAIGIVVSAVRVLAEPVVIDPLEPDTSANHFFHLPSIAALRQLGENHYLTSINRTLTLEADVVPSPFTPLVEWRLDGEPLRDLGAPIFLEVYTAGAHILAAGPPAEEVQVQLDTYLVKITSHRNRIDLVDGVPVTLTAETDPPGYENDIVWLASTEFGFAEPWTGQGREFTVRFYDTLGSERPGIGVRADDAEVSGRRSVGLEQAAFSPNACRLAAGDGLSDPGLNTLVHQFCEGPGPSDAASPSYCDEPCFVKWFDCMQDACSYTLPHGFVMTGPPGLRIPGGCSPNIDVWLHCDLAEDYCNHRCNEPPEVIDPTVLPDP